MSGGGSTPLAAHDVSFVRMIADFIFMRPRDGSGSEVEVRSSQIPSITHVRHDGERICHGSRDSDAYEVTWECEEDTVCVGARF